MRKPVGGEDAQREGGRERPVRFARFQGFAASVLDDCTKINYYPDRDVCIANHLSSCNMVHRQPEGGQKQPAVLRRTLFRGLGSAAVVAGGNPLDNPYFRSPTRSRTCQV